MTSTSVALTPEMTRTDLCRIGQQLALLRRDLQDREAPPAAWLMYRQCRAVWLSLVAMHDPSDEAASAAAAAWRQVWETALHVMA